MTNRDKKYYHQRLSALRNALDVLIEELAEAPADPAPCKRCNLATERIQQQEASFAVGTWKKPKGAKKKKK